MNVEHSNMSCPDYEQSILHHSFLLVLLRGVGPVKPRSLQKAFDKVRRVNNVKITDSNGMLRDIWVRYVHDYPVENNDWGDFQTHRRVLGLVTIGKFETQTELNELCRQHESLKVRYGSTLYDTRAIFFGPTLNDEQASTSSISTTINSFNSANTEHGKHSVVQQQQSKPLQDLYTTPSNFKAQAFFYREEDLYQDLENHITDFVNALFWILESRRLERSREKPEKCYLLTAPFEKREVVGLDRESRNSKKRITGRILKNLADLSLQSGLAEDALSLYHNACDTLKATIDFLWEGAAEEGLCAASAVLLYPHLRIEEPLRRNASLQEGSSPLKNNPEKWRASDATKQVNVNNKVTHGMPATLSTLLTPSQPPHSASASSLASILTNSTLSQISPGSTSSSASSSSTTSPSTLSSAQYRRRQHEHQSVTLPGNILKPEEIPLYFHKAIINYSKYRNAAIVEIETSFKAARISVEQNRPLDVAMVFQNMLCINHSLNELERINMFKMMTAVYQQIGYVRKAAFFQRLAALKYIQGGGQQSDWMQMYRHMLASFPGYMLSLDPLEVLESNSGWPYIQIDLIQNLTTAAKRLGRSTLATRHMTFLLQTQWNHMTENEQKDMAEKLQSLSEQCEGSPVLLVLENGTVIPPANLTDLPYCMELTVKNLSAHLRPQRLKIDKTESGPFLFTPLQFNSLDRRDKQKEKHKIDFCWVQNNLCEVQIRLINPLPFELAIREMRLLTNGIVFRSLPHALALLQPQQPTYIPLYGTPIEMGELEIQGYSTHTLGVKSNCRLKHMKGRKFPPNYLVTVIPELPNITVKTSLPQMATSCDNMLSKDNHIVITSASLTLYNGEASSFVVTVTNNTTVPVEYFEVNVISNVEADVQNRIFLINNHEIQSKLPIAADCSIDFIVNIFAEADFIFPEAFIGDRILSSQHSSKNLQPHYSSSYDHTGSGHSSLPVTMANHPHHQKQQRRHDIDGYSNFRSSTNVQLRSSLGGVSLPATTTSSIMPLERVGSPVKQVEAQFRLKYSGGEAMKEGYCRQCGLNFNLECLPSAQITSWDVLPAEIPSQFYLVLDITNLTAQEMSLNYTSNKNILIEAKESCRVPIAVDRCTLEQVAAAKEAEIAENLEKELCFRSNTCDAVGKLCSKHIADRVQIKWLLTGTSIQGIACLRGITLTQTMLDLCTVSPLQWNVSFKGQPVQPQSEVICIAGESSLLAITVRNQSLQAIKNLLLTIKFYQDYLNGIENYNLDARVAITGPNRICIPILERGENAHHECTILFLTPGRFKATIECHAKPSSLLSRSCPPINNNIIQAQKQQQPQQAHSYYEQEQEHIWKFIPPIEVTVVESQ